MAETLIPRRELEFQLYEVLDIEALCAHPRFQEHSKDIFDATLNTAEKIAEDLFLPHNSKADSQEPVFDGQRVSMLADVKTAFDHYRQAGFIAGRFDFEEGGMQLPETVMSACAGYFMAANPATTAYPFLTAAAANVIKHFASDTLKRQYLPAMLAGEFTGTMALTEPHAGSSLTDIRTRATKADDGSYRIKGSKLYISAGDHELADNIVHLVLAKIPGGPPGVKGISLFVVPKFRLDDQGQPAHHNDVSLAGLIHKMGYRGTTSTALSFGDNDACHGYLVGEPHQGLRYMFMMMNEARIGVGLGAAMIGYRGYRFSLDYAKERTQGRAGAQLTHEDPPSPIICHGDVKRMLLAQKAYTEGGMALCLYGSRLMDAVQTAPDEEEKVRLSQLLDLLTPVFKAWPSEFGPKANDLAIQVLGGAGYTREYPVEQCWRDNRLNPIHEGTNGIQALDLLARKLWQADGQGLQTLQQYIQRDLQRVRGERCQAMAAALMPYLDALDTAIRDSAAGLRSDKAGVLLTNAQCFMNLFASTVVSWIWLRQALVAEAALQGATLSEDEQAFYQGKLAAADYYIFWELPLTDRDIRIMKTQDATCNDMQTNYF